MSTTKTEFPAAVSHMRGHNMDALQKLDSIARGAQNAGRRLERAVRNLDTAKAEDALAQLSSLGNAVNSWAGD